MRLAAVVAATLALFRLGVSPALAQPSATPPMAWQQPPAESYTHEYGTKIALVDGLSLGLVVVGVMTFAGGINESGSDDDLVIGGMLMVGGMAGYVFGGPMVHGAKGNKTGAWKSIGLRVGLPFLGAAIGESMKKEECQIDYCTTSDNGESESLFAVGVLTAMVIDWFVLAKVEKRTSAYTPIVTPVRDGGMTFGIAGSF
jgi:hypothetical protein